MTYLHYLTFERFNTKYLFSQKEECNWNVSEEEKEKDNHPMSSTRYSPLITLFYILVS